MSKKMSITRIQNLAKTYGPSVRFSPEGSEGAVDDALKDAEGADLKDNKEFDKVRQAADQEKANAAKARQEADSAKTQLATATSQNETLKRQLAEATAKAETANVNIELNEADYSDTDLALVRSIKTLNKKIDSKDAVIDALKKDVNDSKAEKVSTQAQADQEAQYQELLNDMDEDYGVQFRNAAVKEFEALHKDGKVVGGAAKATRMLEKCYKNAVKAEAEKEAAKKKDGVRLDSGSGGGGGVNLSGIALTEGSLEEVTAQAGKLLNKSG